MVAVTMMLLMMPILVIIVTLAGFTTLICGGWGGLKCRLIYSINRLDLRIDHVFVSHSKEEPGSLWSRVSQLMRRQEREFKNSMRETRAEYLDRLRRTATSLPRVFVERAISDMAPRCKRLHEANGSHFEEGGKRSR